MKSYQQRTYYELLGLRVNASVDEIRLAYQRISELDDAACLKSYQLENASDLLKLRELLCEAVEFLTDPEIRVEYDRSLTLAAAESAEGNRATIAQLDGTENAEGDRTERAERNHAESAEYEQSEIIQLDGAESAERNPAMTEQLDGGPETTEREHREGAERVRSETIQLDGAESAERNRATPAHFGGSPQTAERHHAEGAEHDQSETVQIDDADSPKRNRATTAHLDGAESAQRSPATTAELDGTPSAGRDRRGNTEPDVESAERIQPEKPEGTAAHRTHHRERDRDHPKTTGRDVAASAERARTETAERDATKGGKFRETTRAERDPVSEPTQLSFPDNIFARESILRQPPPLPVVSYVPRSTPAPFHRDGASSTRLAEAGPRQPHENLENAPVLAEESALASAEAALALVSARVQQFRRPLEIGADAEFNGELLRRVRESQGLALQQLCERTRVSIKHLENIEADRYGALPAIVYLRGILVSLARELKLDPVRVARSYIAAATVAREGKERRSD